MDKLSFLSMVSKIRSTKVTIEDFGDVYVRKLTAGDIASFDEKSKEFNEKNPGNAFAPWLVVGLCDENGQPLFTYDDVEDLASIPMYITQLIVKHIFDVNALTTTTETAVEKAEKNSEKTRS